MITPAVAEREPAPCVAFAAVRNVCNSWLEHHLAIAL